MTETKTRNEQEIARLALELKWKTISDFRRHILPECSFEQNLLSLLQLEYDRRQKDLMRHRIRNAGFPVPKTIDTFIFSETRLPHLKKDQVLELMTCEFIIQGTNALAIGPTGTGKSHIAVAIGMEAIRRGYSVRFFRACDLVALLSEASSEKHLTKMLLNLKKCRLLILDELGYITMDRASANLLFQVLAARYEIHSTIVTSNLEFSKWQEFIGDSTMAAALVDRLVHRSVILNMNGEGYRLYDGRQEMQRQAGIVSAGGNMLEQQDTAEQR